MTTKNTNCNSNHESIAKLQHEINALRRSTSTLHDEVAQLKQNYTILIGDLNERLEVVQKSFQSRQ